MDTIESVGKCFFCNAEFSKAGISRHLNTHLKQQAKVMKPGISFHVRIEDDVPRGLYFLNLWVDGDTLMAEIDGFLRAIWLDCCGHMSAFTNPKERKRYPIFEMESDEGGIMESSTKEILKKDFNLKYDYDFGSTTSLLLTVMEVFPVECPAGIELLSRNKPLEIMCDLCSKEPAAVLCTTCYNPSIFCEKCAKKHAETCEDFAD